MAEKLGLAEIAAKYNKTPKTFSKYVKKLGIPHEALGRFMYFDPDEVAIHLRVTPIDIKVPKTIKVKRGRFAERLGLVPQSRGVTQT